MSVIDVVLMYVLLVVGCGSLFVDCCLLFDGYVWLFVACLLLYIVGAFVSCFWLCVFDHGLQYVVRCLLFVACCIVFGVGRWLSVVGCWLVVVVCWLLIICFKLYIVRLFVVCCFFC